jgi:hypothetical protein
MGQENQAAKPDPGLAGRMKNDPLDFSPARDPLKDIVAELSIIQASLAQYQLPGRPSGSKQLGFSAGLDGETSETDSPPSPCETDADELSDEAEMPAALVL